MYTSEDLKDLANRLREVSKECKEEKPEEAEACRSLYRQIQATRYEPFIFNSLISRYDLDGGILEEPLESLPLRMDNRGLLPETIIKWRFERGV